MDQVANRIHLINDVAIKDKQLNPLELATFLAVNNVREMAKQYNVVSIIGSQSTGKSTLLNKIFGTQFDVQQRNQQLGQTTVGIWLSKDTRSNTLVLDVEGSDSVERKTGETMVENQTALFALALSHAFIINVFLNSLGQHTSCQLSIIRIIMQMNLKLFQQDTVKNIIFVIRDWDEEANYQEAQQRLNGYLQAIWKDISKPEGMENIQFEQLFKVQVETLCYFKMKEFTQETERLRRKLVESSDENFIFKNFEYERNLPADALPAYLSKIWDVIANNKDLNLPNEKVLVSNLRCQQIKVESVDSIKQQLDEIEANVAKAHYPLFGEKAKNAVQEAKSKYFKETKDYAKEVVKEKAVELENEVLSKLYAFFQKQVDQLKRFLSEDIENVLDQLKDQPLKQLAASLVEISSNVPAQFKQEISKSLVEPDIWKEDDHVDSFSRHVQSQLNNFVRNRITVFHQKLDKQVKEQLDNELSEVAVDIGLDFWSRAQERYDQLIANHYKHFEEVLVDFRISDKEREELLSSFEKESVHNLEVSIKNLRATFKDSLYKRFKRVFLRNEDSQPRDWKKMTEEEILHLLNQSRDETWQILAILKTNTMQIKSISTLLYGRKTVKSTLFSSIELGSAEEFLEFEKTVLTEALLNSLKNDLLEEFDTLYQDALQKHRTDFLQSIPKWFWFTLLFFMYDDVLRWLGNPLFLYPILMILCFVGFCIAIGYHSLPKALLGQVIQQFNLLIGPLLFGGFAKLKSA